MDPVSPRQTDILRKARQVGRVEVDDLALQFDVTPQTIRKDLNEICDAGLLQRVHGGAVYPSGAINYAYDARRSLAAEEKRRIGERAAALIPDNSSVILNIGTTTEQVAFALRDREGLMVITNNINVANILRESASTEVIIAGGLVRRSDGGIVGEASIDTIQQFKVDFGIIGISGIDEDGTLLDFDYREVRAAQAIIKNARRVFLATDHTKFGRNAMVRLGHIEQLDAVFTDRAPAQPMMDILAAAEVELHIAP